MGNLKFGDISTQDLGLIIQAPPLYTFPDRDVTIRHIPGKSGNLFIDNKSFANVTRSYSIASIFRSPNDFIKNAEQLVGWLTMNPGYHRLEDSYDPEVYRIASFSSGGSLQNIYDQATVLNITFDCKPQRYLKIGENPIEFTGNEVTIENPTLMDALPKIEISNLGPREESSNNVLMLNVFNYKNESVSSITLSSITDDSVIIDSDEQLVYTIQNGTVKSLNSSTNLNGKEFPKLSRQTTEIILKNYSKEDHEISKYSDLMANSMKTVFAKYLPFDTVVESKQSKATVKSFDALKNSYQEQYEAEAYGNLALDKAEYAEIRSFNDLLAENCFMASFNTDPLNGPYKDLINEIYIGSISDENTYTYNSPEHDYDNPGELKIIDGSLIVFYSPMHKQLYIYALANTSSIGYSTDRGAFVQIEDLSDNEYSSSRIFFWQTLSSPDVFTPSGNPYWHRRLREMILDHDYDELSNALRWVYIYQGICPKLLRDIPKTDNLSHDVVFTLYPTKVPSTPPFDRIIDMPESENSFLSREIRYNRGDSSLQQHDYGCATIDEIIYSPTKAGYYYKESSSGNGILSGIIGTALSSITKLFNKTGWSYISQADLSTSAFEDVKWDTKKRAFVLGNFLSSSTDYVIKRYYVDSDNIPQYDDIELEDVYETDSNGNVIVDIAGNKVHKTLKSRIRINSINDDISEVQIISAKYTGFYRCWNSSKGTYVDGSSWKYYNANDTISPTAIGYNMSCKKSNIVCFLEAVPDYRSEQDFPEWLDPIPVLFSADAPRTPIDVEAKPEKAINAAWYDFIVKKDGWYWYEYSDEGSTTVKKTTFAKRSTGNTIGSITPDVKPERPADLPFTVYLMDYKVDSDTFPIHEYEYVDVTNDYYDGTPIIMVDSYFIANNRYLPGNVYNKGDFVANNSLIIGGLQYLGAYECLEDGTTGQWDPTKWRLYGLPISSGVDEYSESSVYYRQNFVVYEQNMYECTVDPQLPPVTGPFDPDYWRLVGPYIKNIGFYYLTEGGEQEEIFGNIPPEWIKAKIILGSSADYSDTAMEFYVNQNGLYKWDSNSEWLTKNSGDMLVSSMYKTDTSIYFLEELPEYDESEYDDLYSFEITQSSSGNPEKVIIRANQDGYYRWGTSSNYIWTAQNSIITELNVNQSVDITYLNPIEDNSLDNVVITITPRWWSL